VQSWLRDHPTCPFPTPSEKDAMAAALNMAVKRLNHLVYNTRKRMFPGLCKKKAPTRRRMFPGLRTKKDLTRNTSSVQMPEMILEAAAEAERLAAEAEAERAEQERIRAEQYAADQEARRALMDECKEDLCQQEDREEADKWKRDSERQSQLEKEAEIAVCKPSIRRTCQPSAMRPISTRTSRRSKSLSTPTIPWLRPWRRCPRSFLLLTTLSLTLGRSTSLSMMTSTRSRVRPFSLRHRQPRMVVQFFTSAYL